MSDLAREAKRAVQRAVAYPNDVEAQVEAAYACDRIGDESDAIRFYDAAWELGVPDRMRQRFVVGYGSTLRNVGRQSESVEVLRKALSEHPDYVPYSAFLALSLHSEGNHAEGLAIALSALIEAAPETLDGYDRALCEYSDLLLQNHQKAAD